MSNRQLRHPCPLILLILDRRNERWRKYSSSQKSQGIDLRNVRRLWQTNSGILARIYDAFLAYNASRFAHIQTRGIERSHKVVMDRAGQDARTIIVFTRKGAKKLKSLPLVCCGQRDVNSIGFDVHGTMRTRDNRESIAVKFPLIVFVESKHSGKRIRILARVRALFLVFREARRHERDVKIRIERNYTLQLWPKEERGRTFSARKREHATNAWKSSRRWFPVFFDHFHSSDSISFLFHFPVNKEPPAMFYFIISRIS